MISQIDDSTIIIDNNRHGYTIVLYIINKNTLNLYTPPDVKIHKYYLLAPYNIAINPGTSINVDMGITGHLFYNSKRLTSTNKLLNGSPIRLDIVNYKDTVLYIRRGEPIWKIVLDGFDKPKFSVEISDLEQDEFDQETLNLFNTKEVIHSSYYDTTGFFKKIRQSIKSLFKCFMKKEKEYDIILPEINDYNNSPLL